MCIDIKSVDVPFALFPSSRNASLRQNGIDDGQMGVAAANEGLLLGFGAAIVDGAACGGKDLYVCVFVCVCVANESA
jgi:hypothetical protein